MTPRDRPSTATDTVSVRVVEAVADSDGISPLDVSPPLFDAIDSDALNRLYADGRSGVTVEFAFAGYRVTVGGDAQVDLAPLTEL